MAGGRRLTTVLIVAAVASAAFAAVGSAATFTRCGSARDGQVVGAHWGEIGPEFIAISHRTASDLLRRSGPGVEGFRPTLADEVCNVAVSVAARAGVAWAKAPRPSFSLGVRTVGAGRNPYLGTFRCRVLRTARSATGTCSHQRDRYAGAIIVSFRLVRN